MAAPWASEVIRLLGALLLALVVGAIVGHTSIWVMVALAGVLVWHAWHLYTIIRWISAGGDGSPPEMEGIWGELVYRLYRLRKRNRRRKRRINALMREFRDATAAMPDGAVVVNRRGEIQWMNQAAARMLGLKMSSDLGQRIANIVRHPDFVSYIRSDSAERPLAMPSPGDVETSLQVQVAPYGDGMRLVLVKDVSRLARLERMRKDFVANASHELRSPLTVVSGYMETMLEDADTEKEWGLPLREMQRQSRRMIDIVDSLLELSRLENAGEQASVERVDVPGLLALIRKEAASLAKPGQEIRLELACGDGLYGAELELHSAFANLVYNAIKYTAEGGTITMRWSSDPGGASFSVSDTGVGIAPEHLPRLTERFYRVDKGRARTAGGTGLGLAIVKHALQRHGAELEVRSEPGRGSEFLCRFPVQRVLPAEMRGSG